MRLRGLSQSQRKFSRYLRGRTYGGARRARVFLAISILALVFFVYYFSWRGGQMESFSAQDRSWLGLKSTLTEKYYSDLQASENPSKHVGLLGYTLCCPGGNSIGDHLVSSPIPETPITRVPGANFAFEKPARALTRIDYVRVGFLLQTNETTTVRVDIKG